jgi:serine phosphatase RsbU (regulator of sigma subunit)
MVRTFSAQAAVAVQNSRLFAVETESRRVSDGLRRIAERLARPDGLNATLHEIEEIVADLFGASEATFAFADRSALGLPPADKQSWDADLLNLAFRRLAPGDTVQPVVVRPGEDEAADLLIERSGAAQLMLVPVALDRLHGAVLGLALPELQGSRRDAELATSVANELALALENAYLYEQAVSRANNLETIFRISQAVGSSLQVNVVLNRVLDVVQKILSADALALMTYDQRRRTITTAMARGAVSPDLVDRVFTPADDIPGYVFTTGVPATYKDLHEGMGGIAGDAASHGLRSLLAVPLLARGRSIGVLTVFSAEMAAFSEEDKNTLQTFASQAALAIDTARLYSREHEVATILQHSIVPGALAEFDEIETGSVYAPAGGDAEIGGDYYDLFRTSDGRIMFAIADVCGKGVVAATKTSMIKYSVRSLAAAGLSPARILGEVNRMVTETGDPSDIVTLWVGRFDPAVDKLTWASGGHPAGLLLSADDDECTSLSATGPLLGALNDVVYGEQTVRMAADDALLLYTDGVTEARSGNAFFGEERVFAALRTGGSADEIAQRLLVSVRRFVRSELRDDVAVLVLKVRGKLPGRPRGNMGEEGSANGD